MADQLSPHFNRSEFECHCGCGFDTVDPDLPSGLELLRGLVNDSLHTKNTPLVITSGCRCPAYNQHVDGAGDSQHLHGRAADIYIPMGMTAATFADLASHVRQFESGGIGTYPPDLHDPKDKKPKPLRRPRGWVHVDVRPKRSRWEG